MIPGTAKGTKPEGLPNRGERERERKREKERVATGRVGFRDTCYETER